MSSSISIYATRLIYLECNNSGWCIWPIFALNSFSKKGAWRISCIFSLVNSAAFSKRTNGVASIQCTRLASVISKNITGLLSDGHVLKQKVKIWITNSQMSYLFNKLKFPHFWLNLWLKLFCTFLTIIKHLEKRKSDKLLISDITIYPNFHAMQSKALACNSVSAKFREGQGQLCWYGVVIGYQDQVTRWTALVSSESVKPMKYAYQIWTLHLVQLKSDKPGWRFWTRRQPVRWTDRWTNGKT